MKDTKITQWSEKLKQQKPIKSMDLINCEGAILKAHKMEIDQFVIVDQWKKVVAVLDGLQMFEYIRGDFDITDSKDIAWNYKKIHKDMAARPEDLDHFIGIVDG